MVRQRWPVGAAFLSALFCISELLSTTATVISRSPHGSGISDWDAPRPIRRLSLELGEKTVWSDCNPMPESTVINGTTPGPVLRVRAGERLLVNVTNNHPSEPSTVHWHGLSQLLNPASDGTPMISQWPIQPGRWFEYDIRLPIDQTGTYFYHSHFGLQSMTAHGALIIEDPLPNNHKPADKKQASCKAPNKGGRQVSCHDITYGDADLHALGGRSTDSSSPYKWDEDRILLLGDYWGLTTADAISKGLVADPFVWPGNAKSLLLNGRQKGACNQTAVAALGEGLACPNPDAAASPDVPACDYAEIRISYGQTYRFRIIGSQSLMFITIGILGHTVAENRMELIEADGSYLEALPTDHVETGPGQRYSWLIKAKTKEQVAKDGSNGVYWIRMEPRWRAGPAGWARLVYVDDAQTNRGDGPVPSQASANGAAVPPTVEAGKMILPVEQHGWITSQLAPLRSHAPPCPDDSKVTRTVVINTQHAFTAPNSKGVSWFSNSDKYDEETEVPVPYLVAMYNGYKPVPSAKRAFSSKNPYNSPTKSGLIDTDAENLKLARKYHFQQGYDDDTDIYVGLPGEVIDIIIINRPSAISNNTEIHTWHMHASKHWARTSQPGTFSFKAYQAALANTTAYARPVPRDTSAVYPRPGASYLNQTVPDPLNNDGGWSVLRYKVDPLNAGIFPLHCHLSFHLKMGMAVVWGFGLDDLVKGKLSKIYAPTDKSIQGLTLGYLKPGENVAAVI